MIGVSLPRDGQRGLTALEGRWYEDHMSMAHGGLYYINLAEMKLCFPGFPLLCNSRLAWVMRLGRQRWNASDLAFYVLKCGEALLQLGLRCRLSTGPSGWHGAAAELASTAAPALPSFSALLPNSWLRCVFSFMVKGSCVSCKVGDLEMVRDWGRVQSIRMASSPGSQGLREAIHHELWGSVDVTAQMPGMQVCPDQDISQGCLQQATLRKR